jgi:hypothetical protein
MSVETRIPRASSERWSSLTTKEEKDKFVQQYKTWKNNPFTKEFISFLEKQMIEETIQQDKKENFLSLFSFRFSEAVSRGKRTVLRELIKII